MPSTFSPYAAHYAHPHVRARLAEFFGGDGASATAVFLAAGSESASQHRERLPLALLPASLDAGAEVNRSLWDRRSLVVQLDLEYVNFDAPGRAYLEPERIFGLQEPVVATALSLLADFGIAPLHLLTGRGHHLVWRIEQASPACARLAALGRVGPTLAQLYRTEHGPRGETVPPALGAAWAGLGLVIEFLAIRLKALAAPLCEVPVELAAIETGAGAHGRELIAVDITEYSDPLCSRVTRAAFSAYLKPSQQRHAIGEEVASLLPPIFIIPRENRPLAEALHIMRDADAVKQIAATAHTAIPAHDSAMDRLIDAYEASPLARFHRDFYSQEHDAPELWPETYDRAPLEALPPCARRMLEEPNDLLVRPACAQRVVRVMLALGWHPRHIAGLIWSKYERDYGWGDQWHGCDPATRADFYARLFAGIFVTGADELVDFNCQSAQEEGLCLIEDCHENLQRFRRSLRDRKIHERLACRPFNRLFLPTEHL